jgi:uncharacterized protein (TIGR01319 family)
MESALLIDIGSTYTKVSLFDLEGIELIARSQAHTTVKDDVTIGLKKALADIPGWEKARYKLACSSAAGGLKIIAVGLVPDLTAEAAKRAALGAGGRVLHSYSFELTEREIKDIGLQEPDLILLAGGTDGGNRDNIIHNAYMIAGSGLTPPIIIAGNKSVAEEVVKILQEGGKETYLTENVMPELEKLNIEPAREMIRNIFLNRIIQARGLDLVNLMIDGVIMPTPAAVLKAARLLADGTESEEGLGELIIIDVGGATTDIHSIATGKPTRADVHLRGLEEPYAKRTVEGDLGMRYSAPSLYRAIGSKSFNRQLNKPGLTEICAEECQTLINKFHQSVNYIPEDLKEIAIENILGRNAVRLAVARHVGILKTIYTPMGATSIQEGKDLTEVKYVIGTGGIIVNNPDYRFVLEGALYDNQDNPELLAPLEPELMIDKEYLLAACGLLAGISPEISLKLLKRYLQCI